MATKNAQYGRKTIADGYVPYAPVKQLPAKAFDLIATYKIAEPWTYDAGKAQNRRFGGGYKWFGNWQYRDPAWFPVIPPEDPTTETFGDDLEDYDLNDGVVDISYTEYLPQPNYHSFIHWNTTFRSIDLMGKSWRSDNGPTGVTSFDIYPGNKLYVDMCGSPGFGSLQLKQAISMQTDNWYRFTIDVAGNYRNDSSALLSVDFTQGRIGNFPALGSDLIQRYIEQFTPRQEMNYTFKWTMSPADVQPVLFLQSNIDNTGAQFGGVDEIFGPVIFSIKIEHTDDPNGLIDWEQIFFDNFNFENPQEFTSDSTVGQQNISLPEYGFGFHGSWTVRELGSIFGYDTFEDYSLRNDDSIPDVA